MAEPPDDFEEKHRNDSRQWLTNFGAEWTYRSSMKDGFPPPVQGKPRYRVGEGIRRRKTRQDIWLETALEILEERKTKPPVAEYCTTYDSELQVPGFVVKEITEETTDLHRKYPLYRSQQITAYTQIVENSIKGDISIPGLTKIEDGNNPFRRSYYFSRPLNERYDSPYW